MTFSLRPRRRSTRPAIDASVRTRVVSWNEAAETNESVERDAFVIPRRSGRPCAGLPPAATIRSFSSRKRNLSTCSSIEELGVADLLDADAPHHLADDDLDVLVVDADALRAVDLLDLVGHVPLQLLLALDGEDVVRRRIALGQGIARLDALAFLDHDVRAARDEDLALLPVLGLDDELLLPLDRPGVPDDAGDLGDDRRLLRAARLEELDDAREAADDVAGPLLLDRLLGERVARVDRVAVGDHEVRRESGGRSAAPSPSTPRTTSCGRALLGRPGRLDDDLLREAGDLVGLLAQVLAVDDVLEDDLAGDLGEDRRGERVPVHEELARLDLFAVRRPSGSSRTRASSAPSRAPWRPG